MSSIKKAFAPIVEFLQSALETNPKVRLSDVIDDVVGLASAKTGAGGGKATTFHRDGNGVVVAIKDYYSNLWMDPRVVEFSEKKSSASGYNTMSKETLSAWTKQNNGYKTAQAQLLKAVAAGEIEATNIAAELAKLEEAKDARHPREDGYGFETLEEVLADSRNRGLEVADAPVAAE